MLPSPSVSDALHLTSRYEGSKEEKKRSQREEGSGRTLGSPLPLQKLFGIYFGGYREYVSDDFVSSLDEHSKLCED